MLSDVTKVLNREYMPENRYERVLRWLALLNQANTAVCKQQYAKGFTGGVGLADDELEHIASVISSHP